VIAINRFMPVSPSGPGSSSSKSSGVLQRQSPRLAVDELQFFDFETSRVGGKQEYGRLRVQACPGASRRMVAQLTIAVDAQLDLFGRVDFELEDVVVIALAGGEGEYGAELARVALAHDFSAAPFHVFQLRAIVGFDQHSVLEIAAAQCRRHVAAFEADEIVLPAFRDVFDLYVE
jgi:uncharacterized protein YjeT (DUF2065 family)